MRQVGHARELLQRGCNVLSVISKEQPREGILGIDMCAFSAWSVPSHLLSVSLICLSSICAFYLCLLPPHYMFLRHFSSLVTCGMHVSEFDFLQRNLLLWAKETQAKGDTHRKVSVFLKLQLSKLRNTIILAWCLTSFPPCIST
jgi:hypothetical protein